MIITYHSNNYFKIQSGETVILIDPDNQRSFKGAALVLNTRMPALAAKPDENTPAWVEHQGEYEVKEVRVRGWSATKNDGYDNNDDKNSGKEQTIYKISFDDITIGIFGYLENEPSKEIQEFLKGADILIVPASGKPYLSQASIARTIRQIEPGLVIPSLFKNFGDLKIFLKELNQSPKEEEKLVIKKKDIGEKAMMVRVLRA